MATITVWSYPSVKERERRENGVIEGTASTLDELISLVYTIIERGGAIGYSQENEWFGADEAMNRVERRDR